MKLKLILALCLVTVCAVVTPAVTKPAGNAADEEHRKAELKSRLCTFRELNCAYVTTLFDDPRLALYTPPEPAPAPTSPVPREHERNPYFTTRFGLLTPESLERCANFVQAHYFAFETARTLYGVPKEVICGHLRIETDFGIPTRLSPHPTGTIPAIDRLVTLYVRRPARRQSRNSFAQRQTFALNQLKDLLVAASANGWDLFNIPGSSTGAIGLVQFEPSSFRIAVDGDGDGKIDLFNPEDAIVSIAHYLSTRGWDNQPQHQYRAVYAYYGGHYDHDPYKYYMKAVLRYAEEMNSYFKDHPVVPASVASIPWPMQSTPLAEPIAPSVDDASAETPQP